MKNQLEFSKKDKHQKFRAELVKEACELGKLGVKFDVPKVFRKIEYMDLSNVGAASVSDVLDSVLLSV